MVPSELVDSLEQLPAPRVERTRMHRLGEVLVVAVLAVTDAELATQKAELITKLGTRRSTESIADFFVPLGPLLDSGELVEGDIAALKVIHAKIYAAR